MIKAPSGRPAAGCPVSAIEDFGPTDSGAPAACGGGRRRLLRAAALGIDDIASSPHVWIGERWFAVVGVLAPVALAPEIDHDALVGPPVAASALGYDGHPTRVYVRADVDRVSTVSSVLARTVYPEHPDQVAVSRPSDALAAQLEVRASGTNLLLGLGIVALLVGGVGIANVMFVSVYERRPEIDSAPPRA